MRRKILSTITLAVLLAAVAVSAGAGWILRRIARDDLSEAIDWGNG